MADMTAQSVASSLGIDPSLVTDSDISQLIQLMNDQAQQTYQNNVLNQVSVPGLGLQNDQLAFQKAVEAFQQQMAEKQFALQQGLAVGNYGGQNTLGEQQLMGQGLNGQNDLEAQRELGSIGGQPTLAAGEAIGSFGGQQTTAQEALSGLLNGGGQTMGQENLSGFLNNGNATLPEQQFQANTALDAMRLLGSLQSNPFAMERVAHGMDSTGVPNLIRNLFSPGGQTAGFQGAQATPMPPSLAGLAGMITGQGPTQQGLPPATTATGLSAGDALSTQGHLPDRTVQSAPMNALSSAVNGGGVAQPSMSASPSGQTGPAEQAGMNMTNTMGALGSPNKMNAPEFAQLSPSAQTFTLDALGEQGYNPDDVKDEERKMLPQYSTPRYGDVSA